MSCPFRVLAARGISSLSFDGISAAAAWSRVPIPGRALGGGICRLNIELLALDFGSSGLATCNGFASLLAVSGRGSELDGSSPESASTGFASLCIAKDSWIFSTMAATLLRPPDSAVPFCHTSTFMFAFVRRFLLLLLGQSLPVLAHRRSPDPFTGVSSGRGEPPKAMLFISGSRRGSPPPLLIPYRCHRSAAGSASGVRCSALPAKNAEASARCDDVFGHEGDEDLALFRFRFGVSCVEELFGIQPMCSSGDSSLASGFLVSSTFPMRSSSDSRAPGVDGKVFAWHSCGALVDSVMFVDESVLRG